MEINTKTIVEQLRKSPYVFTQAEKIREKIRAALDVEDRAQLRVKIIQHAQSEEDAHLKGALLHLATNI